MRLRRARLPGSLCVRTRHRRTIARSRARFAGRGAGCRGGSGGRRRAAWVGLVGAVLFLLSDCVLAYNLFVQPIAFGRIGTMVPYYLGQLGIALSALGTPTSPATTKASSKATNATPHASSKATKETKRA